MTTDTYPVGPVQKAQAREFDDPDVAKLLAGLSIESLVERFGPPHIVTRYTQPARHWREGMPRPALASDDPAVMQAIGRCSVARQHLAAGKVTRSLHDRDRCAWCEYPADELLAACDWAVWNMAYIEAEFAVWYEKQLARKGATHQRLLRSDVYANETWAAFWSLPSVDRQARITAAQYPEEDHR